jgi:hypothetical protein
MRRPDELRRQAALAASASVAIALIVAFAVFLALGREGGSASAASTRPACSSSSPSW